MVLRTVYLPKTLDNRLRDLAFKLAMSKGEFVRLLIQEALDRRALGEKSFGQELSALVEQTPSTAQPGADQRKTEDYEDYIFPLTTEGRGSKVEKLPGNDRFGIVRLARIDVAAKEWLKARNVVPVDDSATAVAYEDRLAKAKEALEKAVKEAADA